MRIQTILEKTFDISSDVNMIYNKYFKSIVDAINGLSWDGYGLTPVQISSHEFTSPDGIRGNKISPCRILIGGGHGNTYEPQKMIIRLNLHEMVLDHIRQYRFNIDKATESIPPHQKASFRNEITEGRIKGTISHEISHWLDDVINNRHIRKYVKDRDVHSLEYRNNSKYSNETATKFELNAQIHAIKELKQSLRDKRWDFMTFEDLFTMSAPLRTIKRILSDDDKVFNQWKKDLLSRMAREGLIGKNMR